jgi:hypothetical protein
MSSLPASVFKTGVIADAKLTCFSAKDYEDEAFSGNSRHSGGTNCKQNLENGKEKKPQKTNKQKTCVLMLELMKRWDLEQLNAVLCWSFSM